MIPESLAVARLDASASLASTLQIEESSPGVGEQTDDLRGGATKHVGGTGNADDLKALSLEESKQSVKGLGHVVSSEEVGESRGENEPVARAEEKEKDVTHSNETVGGSSVFCQQEKKENQTDEMKEINSTEDSIEGAKVEKVDKEKVEEKVYKEKVEEKVDKEKVEEKVDKENVEEDQMEEKKAEGDASNAASDGEEPEERDTNNNSNDNHTASTDEQATEATVPTCLETDSTAGIELKDGATAVKKTRGRKNKAVTSTAQGRKRQSPRLVEKQQHKKKGSRKQEETDVLIGPPTVTDETA